MILEYDGNLFELAFAELEVSLKLPLKNKSVSGSTSATDTVNTGTKAKSLSVAGTLRFNQSEHLSDLIKVAEAEDDDGARRVYNISDDTATAADIRQVIFDGDFNVRKVKELNAWNVTFNLLQKNSVAEAKAERAQTDSNPVTDTATGTAVTTTDDTTVSIIDTNTSIYKILKKIDNYLAPDDEDS